jgi:hypothetical protein
MLFQNLLHEIPVVVEYQQEGVGQVVLGLGILVEDVA